MKNGGWEDGGEPCRKSSGKLAWWQNEYSLDLASPVRSVELDSMIVIGTFQLEIFYDSFLYTHMDKSMYARKLDKRQLCMAQRISDFNSW